MRSPEPLERLAELAQEARDAAGKALANERRTQQQAVEQVETLRRYRLEYAERLQDVMHAGIDPATLRNYQQFLGSLDSAIERARHNLDDQQQRVVGCQQHWQQQQRQLSSYNTLALRRADRLRHEEQRREQRHNDEMSANSLLRRRINGD